MAEGDLGVTHLGMFVTALVAILVFAFIVPSFWNTTLGAAVPQLQM
jgi:hypothetical protein